MTVSTRIGRALTVAALATASAVAVAAPASAACEESTYRTYSVSEQRWDPVTGAREFAPGTSGSYAVTSSRTETRTATLTASVGAGVDVVIAELRNDLSVSYAKTVTIERSETTTINVPRTSYTQLAQLGIWRVKYYVTATRVTPSCARTPAGAGYLFVYRERAALSRA